MNKTFAFYTKGSSYILKDGQFLNISVIHSQFETKLTDLLGEKKRIDIIKRYSAIKINDGSNFKWENAYACLPNEPITKEQEKSLLDFFYILIERNIHKVYIAYEIIDAKDMHNAKEYSFKSINNDDGYFPEDIIKEIKKLYYK